MTANWKPKVVRVTHRIAVLVGLLALWSHSAQAQAMAEAGTLTSRSATTAASAQPVSPAMTPATPPAKSEHLTARTGAPPDETNRKDFEGNAGENAGKLLFRSVPSGAEIFINGLLVGRTPLLMVIAPGKYNVEMRGSRQESGHVVIGVLPKETQTVMLKLNERYPASLVLR